MKDVDFRIFGNLVKIKICVFFVKIPKPAVSQLVGGDQICNDGEMALLVYYSTLSITARAIVFFIKTHLSLKLNLDI